MQEIWDLVESIPRGRVASYGDIGAALKAAQSEGVVYPSVRDAAGECVGLFYPDQARNALPTRHFDYHWNGVRVDYVRDAGSREVFAIAR